MNSQEMAFQKLIHTLDESHVLPDIMVVGSWAEYLYVKANILQYDFSLKTQDIDILVPNIRRPSKKINLAQQLEEHGFRALHGDDGLVKFNYLGLIEVEFLARELNRGQIEPYDTNLSVTAQGLRNMEILLYSPATAKYDGCSIIVPSPEAYILHKLVINEERNGFKREKDVLAVQRLFLACRDERDDFDATIAMQYSGLTAKQKKKIRTTIRHFQAELECIADFLNIVP